MQTLAQNFDADRLAQAIRQEPIPARAASLAAEAVGAARGASQAPSLEAQRMAEEAIGAVQESLFVLSACVFLPPPPPRRPPPLPPSPPLPSRLPPLGRVAPTIDRVAFVPLVCAVVALPLQQGMFNSLFVLAAAVGSAVVVWRSYRPPRWTVIAPPPVAPPPVAPPSPPPPPPEPPPPAVTLQPETIAAAVQRALAQIDKLLAHTERRRVARTEPSTLNDTTLEFLQDLAEAALRNRAEFALAKIEFRLPVVLEACDLQAVEYAPDTAPHFDVDGDPAHAATRRPALLADGGRCVKRGLAATRPGRPQ